MGSMDLDNIVAFTATQFQPVLTTAFFIDYAQRVLIEGFALEKAFDAMLTASSQSNIARHTGVVHIHREDGASLQVWEYKFAHNKFRPWGNNLPGSCPTCGSPQSWGRPVTQKEALVFSCKFKKCKGRCRFVKPEGFERLKGSVNGGSWLCKSYKL
jgi:hypothetical protein